MSLLAVLCLYVTLPQAAAVLRERVPALPVGPRERPGGAPPGSSPVVATAVDVVGVFGYSVHGE
jgi:hypothetical protein